MGKYAEVNWDTTPPAIDIPRDYNAVTEFVDRNLEAGRGKRIALIDDAGSYTYAELAELGVVQESKVFLCLTDSVDFPTVFWAVVRLGAVAIPINTLLTSKDYDYMLRDSRAATVVISDVLYDKFTSILGEQPHVCNVVVSGQSLDGEKNLTQLMSGAPNTFNPAPTTADDVAFWLYTSGSTGTPKGSMHLHRDLVVTAVLYGIGVLDIQIDDVVFSAVKFFFAYGLGNSMSFPFYVGATAVVMAERPTPDAVMGVLKRHSPSLFFGVPTLYGAILSNPDNNRAAASARLRLCVSAGEALPAAIGESWEQRFTAPILDGLGSTEMLHIFLSARAGDLRYGTTGKPVPGYTLKLLTEEGEPAAPEEFGELWVKGGSSAVAYWNQREKSLSTFHGPWTRTGDKYVVDGEGFYHYRGRTDDMLKVSGQWVSPFEVESALNTHDKVLEAAVVARADEDGLTKPMAYLLLSPGVEPSQALVEEVQTYIKEKLAPFKYPRWIEFVDDLPRTATGKILDYRGRDNHGLSHYFVTNFRTYRRAARGIDHRVVDPGGDEPRTQQTALGSGRRPQAACRRACLWELHRVCAHRSGIARAGRDKRHLVHFTVDHGRLTHRWTGPAYVRAFSG